MVHYYSKEKMIMINKMGDNEIIHGIEIHEQDLIACNIVDNCTKHLFLINLYTKKHKIIKNEGMC